MRLQQPPKPQQTAAAPQWDYTVLAAGRARGLAGRTSASLEPRACAPCKPRQWCALRAGLRPPLTRSARRPNLDQHRRASIAQKPTHGGAHALTPPKTTTLQACAAPSPHRRSRSPKRSVTMPKPPVTIDRNARSRWTETTGHIRRNTQFVRPGRERGSKPVRRGPLRISQSLERRQHCHVAHRLLVVRQ